MFAGHAPSRAPLRQPKHFLRSGCSKAPAMVYNTGGIAGLWTTPEPQSRQLHPENDRTERDLTQALIAVVVLSVACCRTITKLTRIPNTQYKKQSEKP